MKDTPSYTVVYNIVTENSPYIGTGWEFFDTYHTAMKRYDELNKQGHCATRRPFNETCDRPHMGAVHRKLNVQGSYENAKD